MKEPNEYFEQEYGVDHLNDVMELKDLKSLYGLIKDYAEYYHKSKAENLPISDVSKCVCTSEPQYRNCDNLKCSRAVLDE